MNCLNTNLTITQSKQKKICSFNFTYNLFVTKIEAFKKYQNDNLKKEFIQFSWFFADAFIMFVKVKNENLRLCVNYRNLNYITIKNWHLILLIKQLLNRLIIIAIFTKINTRSVYNALRIWANYKWKTAFRCRYKHFEYRVMFFKFANASANFQLYSQTLSNYLDRFLLQTSHLEYLII